MENITDVLASASDRFNFMKGLIILARSQEITEGRKGIDTEEEIFFQNAMIALNISDEDQKILSELLKSINSDLNIVFSSKKQSLFFIREGIQICYVDGNYSDVERITLHKLASILKIKKENVIKIEEWVSMLRNITNKGDELLYIEEV